MKSIILPLDGWAAKELEKLFKADFEFFQAFENEDILGADVDVVCKAAKRGQDIILDLSMNGTLTVSCDRCLEKLELPVSENAALLATSDNSDVDEINGREIIYKDPTLKSIDLSQVVYDYILLSLPMQKVHPDGQCNPATVHYLDVKEEIPADAKDENPFSVLKGLLGEK